jgi:hypothetical protein
MRSGGRPKNLNSGARWVNAVRGGRKPITKKEKKQIPFDIDGDGIVTPFEINFYVWTYIIVGFATILFLIGFFIMAYWGIQLQKIK